MITRKISSSGTDVLNPLTGRHPVNSTILGKISGSAPPPVIYNNTSFPSLGSTQLRRHAGKERVQLQVSAGGSTAGFVGTGHSEGDRTGRGYDRFGKAFVRKSVWQNGPGRYDVEKIKRAA